MIYSINKSDDTENSYQRIANGYCNDDVLNFADWFVCVIPEMLNQYKLSDKIPEHIQYRVYFQYKKECIENDKPYEGFETIFRHSDLAKTINRLCIEERNKDIDELVKRINQFAEYRSERKATLSKKTIKEIFYSMLEIIE